MRFKGVDMCYYYYCGQCLTHFFCYLFPPFCTLSAPICTLWYVFLGRPLLLPFSSLSSTIFYGYIFALFFAHFKHVFFILGVFPPLVIACPILVQFNFSPFSPIYLGFPFLFQWFYFELQQLHSQWQLTEIEGFKYEASDG